MCLRHKNLSHFLEKPRVFLLHSLLELSIDVLGSMPSHLTAQDLWCVSEEGLQELVVILPVLCFNTSYVVSGISSLTTPATFHFSLFIPGVNVHYCMQFISQFLFTSVLRVFLFIKRTKKIQKNENSKKSTVFLWAYKFVRP